MVGRTSPARRDVPPDDQPGALAEALARLADAARCGRRRRRRAARRVSDAGFDLDRPPLPVRPRRWRRPCRPDRRRPPRSDRSRRRCGGRPGCPRRGDGPAAGATAIRPRLALELATELAGTRGLEELTAGDAVDRAARGVRRRPAQDARPDGDLDGRVVHRRGAHRDDRARAGGRRPVLPRRARLARDRRLRRDRAPDRRPRRGRPDRRRGHRAEPAHRSGSGPVPGRRRASRLRAGRRRGDPGPRDRRHGSDDRGRAGRVPRDDRPRAGHGPRAARARGASDRRCRSRGSSQRGRSSPGSSRRR